MDERSTEGWKLKLCCRGLNHHQNYGHSFLIFMYMHIYTYIYMYVYIATSMPQIHLNMRIGNYVFKAGVFGRAAKAGMKPEKSE